MPEEEQDLIGIRELLEAEREAVRRADTLALLALQELKQDAIRELQALPDDEREALAEYARENLRRIRHLLRCYEGCLDLPPATYAPTGRLRAGLARLDAGR